MKTTGGFKLWQIIYPIGIYYVVSSLMYFVLGLFLGDGQQTYMLRQLICSAATIPATMSFYKQDKIAEQVVYGTEKEKEDSFCGCQRRQGGRLRLKVFTLKEGDFLWGEEGSHLGW